MSGQTRRASSQFASWSFAPSAPMNVLTSGTPIASAAVMTCLRWPMTSAAMGGVGVERVRVVAEPGDGEALRGDLVDDLGRLAGGQVRDVDVAVPAYRRVGPEVRGQQAISMLSKPLAAVQSATSVSGVSGNGAVSRPSLIGRRPSRESPVSCPGIPSSTATCPFPPSFSPGILRRFARRPRCRSR